MMNIYCKIFLLLFFLLLAAGCAPVISEQLRLQARQDITFREVFNDPEEYKGEIIIVSGVIIEAINTHEGTLMTILQRPSDSRGMPQDVDTSEGRFLALHTHYLDVEVYKKGRKVTIAGNVQGKRSQPLGEIQYDYPLIHVEELYLWPEIQRYDYPSYHYPHRWRRYYWCY
ncbi:MAG: Slp family lipoprotein [Candidatus Brocadiaceae bacterium]|nr:Slp family lipoprotein [Candidatus Brocadiaceae bacterium]